MRSKDIKSIMETQQWDSEETAIALGVTIEAVWHWLADRRSPRLSAKRLLEFLEDFPELGPALLRFGRKKAKSASR